MLDNTIPRRGLALNPEYGNVAASCEQECSKKNDPHQFAWVTVNAGLKIKDKLWKQSTSVVPKG